MNKALKLFVDLDKEERWLNRKAAEGHLLTRVGAMYSFTPTTPGSAVVRIDYQPHMSAADFEDYTTLFSDAGWRHLSGSRTSGHQYFASTSSAPDDEIFSEARSKAQRYRRALGVNAVAALPFAVVAFVLLSTRSPAFDNLLTPSAWYLTPGLWDMQGWQLLGAFLFETPFVALRVGGPVLLVVVPLAMLSLVAYQYLLYRRALTDSACDDAAGGDAGPMPR